MAQSIYFSPTALTHIKRLIEMGGSIITDTTLVANDISAELLGSKGAKVLCFIDDPQVVMLAEQRRVTRAEVAVDYGLAVPGLKLMVVGQRARGHQPADPAAHARADVGRVRAGRAQRLRQRRTAQGAAAGQRPWPRSSPAARRAAYPATVTLVNAILREISGKSIV